MLDGVGYNFDTWEFTDSDVHAHQWYDTQGETEPVDQTQPNTPITDIATVQPYIDKVNTYLASLPPSPPDDSYTQYFEGAWTKVPVAIDLNDTVQAIKVQAVRYEKQQTYSYLETSDWYILRETEGIQNAPQAVSDFRLSVHTTSDARCTEILALTTKTEVIDYYAGTGTVTEWSAAIQNFDAYNPPGSYTP
jgi:hypothetical protein